MLTLYQARWTLAAAEPDVYALHRLVMTGFPVELAATRVLFAVHERRVVVQAPLPPRYAEAEVTACYPVYDRGAELAFELLANPTVKRAGRRVPLPLNAAAGWLRRKAQGWQPVHLECAGPVLRRGLKPGCGEVSFSGVRFCGVLRVTDPVALLAQVASGIGPAKGLGFGLLLLGAAP